MADNFTVDNGTGTDFKVKAKEGEVSAYVQAVELGAVSGGVTSYVAKAEDAAHASGDLGIQALAVRKDTAAALAGTDGDYAPLLVDATGQLYINIGSMPGASRTTDSMAVAQQTDSIMNGLTALTPKYAAVTATAAGDNQVVAAVASKKIRVLQAFAMAITAETVQFQDGAGTNLTGPIALGATGGFVLPFSPVGWFETAAGQKLDLNNVGGADVQGVLAYVEV